MHITITLSITQNLPFEEKNTDCHKLVFPIYAAKDLGVWVNEITKLGYTYMCATMVLVCMSDPDPDNRAFFLCNDGGDGKSSVNSKCINYELKVHQLVIGYKFSHTYHICTLWKLSKIREMMCEKLQILGYKLLTICVSFATCNM